MTIPLPPPHRHKHTHIPVYIYIYTSDVIEHSEVHGHPRHVGVVGDSEVSALVEVAAVALAVGELQRVEVTYE
jgi:hypothetical protein